MFEKRLKAELRAQQEAALYRRPVAIDKRDGRYVYIGGQKLINFASNDYLGLAVNRSLQKKIAANFKKYPASSSSSRIVSGYTRLHEQAEKACAEYFGYDNALFYPSGYQANLGLVSTLFDENDCIFYDKHIHASLAWGLMLNRAECHGYNHNDCSHLEKRIAKSGSKSNILITESLFSMDGDLLDVVGTGRIKEEYNIFTIVDEAHSFGVLGEKGRGVSRAVSDIAIGTFGKALGLFGAFILLPETVKEYLINFSSPQIYTTALPPAHAASVLDILECIEQSDKQRKKVAEISQYMKEQLRAKNFTVSGDAHVLAIRIGDEKLATAVAACMKKRGIFTFAARYPTVAYGKAIIRVSMNALLKYDDIDEYVNLLAQEYDRIDKNGI